MHSPQPSQVHTLQTAPGVRLTVETFSVPSPDGPMVMLMHGGGQNRHAWTATARRLQDAGYAVTTFDARGHGDSSWDPSGAYEFADLVADLLAVKAHFAGGRKVVAVGASMGGQTVLASHSVAAADIWAGIVLVDVTPRPESDGVRRIFDFMSGHPDGFAELSDAADAIAAYNPHRPRPQRLEGLHKVLRRRADGRWAWHWDPAFIASKVEAMNDASQWNRYMEEVAATVLDGARRVKAPTLLVRGALSDVVSDETIAEFMQTVPHAKVVDVSEAGHMIAGDNNHIFTNAVQKFLREVCPASASELRKDRDRSPVAGSPPRRAAP